MLYFTERYIKGQIARGKIQSTDEELYRYGYQLLWEKIAALVLTLLIAAFFRAYIELFIFCIGFISLRTYAGGYHTSHWIVCMVMSGSVFVGSVLLSRWIVDLGMGTWIYIGDLICIPFLCAVSPVEHKNRKISKSERQYFRKVIRIVALAQVLVEGLLLVIHHAELGVIVVVAHMVLSISLLMQLWINKMYKKRKVEE